MRKTKFYAGIGSRATPNHILEIMTDLASKLEKDDWVLRSGGATGADTAFEKGVFSNKNKKIFYANSSNLSGKIGKEAYATVDYYHPFPTRLSSYARNLMARNAFQILGDNLREPSSFVVCWAMDSKWNKENKIKSVKGGTGQAVRIAYDYEIEVFNLSHKPHLDRILKYMSSKLPNSLEQEEQNEI